MDEGTDAGMKRLRQCFERVRSEGRAALICYVTAGDPSLKFTRSLVCELAEAGADIVELGVPFSDPIADGPTIQQSSQRALAGGTSVPGVLDCINKIREQCQVPLVAMTYLNPIERYGLDRFAQDAAEAGLDGVLITDLPPEEASDWVSCARKWHLDTVFLAAPTSTMKRLRSAARLSSGFLYCVSRLGVTGARKDLPTDVEELVQRAREVARSPICVGFGIATPEHVRAVARLADGVVVGSALVSVMAEQKSDHERLVQAIRLVRCLAEATRHTV